MALLSSCCPSPVANYFEYVTTVRCSNGRADLRQLRKELITDNSIAHYLAGKEIIYYRLMNIFFVLIKIVLDY